MVDASSSYAITMERTGTASLRKRWKPPPGTESVASSPESVDEPVTQTSNRDGHRPRSPQSASRKQSHTQTQPQSQSQTHPRTRSSSKRSSVSSSSSSSTSSSPSVTKKKHRERSRAVDLGGPVPMAPPPQQSLLPSRHRPPSSAGHRPPTQQQRDLVLLRYRHQPPPFTGLKPHRLLGPRGSNNDSRVEQEGGDDEDEPIRGEDEDPPGHERAVDRPPSRQRHAFPTHLLDTRAFLSSRQQHQGIGDEEEAAPIHITPWHHEDDDVADGDDTDKQNDPHGSHSQGPKLTTSPTMVNDTDDGASPTLSQRPPSRYMTKAQRRRSRFVNADGTNNNDDENDNNNNNNNGNTPELPTTADSLDGDDGVSVSTIDGRLPSRRGVRSLHRPATRHDPRTDGFADVDESVPPPFRVEISTDSGQSQYLPGDRQQSRRWSSAATSTPPVSAMDETELQWFGGTDQTNDGHLFETVSSPVVKPGGHGRRGFNATPSAARTEATALGNGSLPNPWFRASSNPFFADDDGAGSTAMDMETALANTPLLDTGDGDLMAAFTQLSDLRLDDFQGDSATTTTALPRGNEHRYKYSANNYTYGSSQVAKPWRSATQSITPSIPAMAVSRVGEVSSDGSPTTPPSATLHTSLGKDFLSLFAQH